MDMLGRISFGGLLPNSSIAVSGELAVDGSYGVGQL
jgi:hypothetical protein